MRHERDQAVVLGYVLDQRVTTTADLEADLGWRPERVGAALAGLEGAGLLDCRCGLVGPSKAAYAFDAST